MARASAIRERALATIIRGLQQGLREATPGTPMFLTVGQDVARELLAVLQDAQAADDTPPAHHPAGTTPPISPRVARLLMEMLGGENHQTPPKS